MDSKAIDSTVTTIGIGKNSFHLVGLNARSAIVLRHKLSKPWPEAVRGAHQAHASQRRPCAWGTATKFTGRVLIAALDQLEAKLDEGTPVVA